MKNHHKFLIIPIILLFALIGVGGFLLVDKTNTDKNPKNSTHPRQIANASTSSPLDDFHLFVNDSEASNYFPKWSAQNSGETSRWTAYKTAIFAGLAPSPPAMTSRYGASLIDGGILYLHSFAQPPGPTTTPTITTTPTTTTTPPTTTAPNVSYIFDDEFNGAANAPPDVNKWWATPWCSTSSEDVLGCFNTKNVYQDGQGNLVLKVSTGTAGKTYDFARVQTFREGGWPPPAVLWSHNPPIRIEVKAKFAPGAGLWEGIWADGTNAANPLELDTQEFRGAVPTIDTCHVHGPVSNGATIDTTQNLSSAYHVYWVNYYTDHSTFGIDNTTCGQFATPIQQESIRISAIVGPAGTWGGQGGPPPASALPALTLVDYVRVTAL